MAKTKRTAKEVESTVESTVAAASNDSKLITQSKLSRFATGFWNRIKTRYDGTFKSARLSESNSNDKKLIFTKTDNGIHEVELTDYVRIQDKNDFKQDVSSNVGMVDGTLKLGSINGNHNQNRISGYRSITTKQFTDSYVSYLSVLTDESLVVGSNSSWTVWAVEKKANRTEDVVYKKYTSEAVVKEIGIDGTNYKYVNLTIEEKFDREIYFVVGCEDRTKGYRVISLKAEYRNNDVVNVSTRPNVGENITWEPVHDNIAVMIIHGRESIGSLSEKINKLNSDSGLYVKQEEVSASSIPNKVVKLGNDGKLDKNMLPSIAINEYVQINDFTEDILRQTRYENGDIVVVTNNSSSNYGKKYLCINKVDSATANLRDAFIELNSKEGSVLSVNEKTGAITLALEAAADKLKLKITGAGGTTDAETSVPIVTDTEIDAIIAGLTD